MIFTQQLDMLYAQGARFLGSSVTLPTFCTVQKQAHAKRNAAQRFAERPDDYLQILHLPFRLATGPNAV